MYFVTDCNASCVLSVVVACVCGSLARVVGLGGPVPLMLPWTSACSMSNTASRGVVALSSLWHLVLAFPAHTKHQHLTPVRLMCRPFMPIYPPCCGENHLATSFQDFRTVFISLLDWLASTTNAVFLHNMYIFNVQVHAMAFNTNILSDYFLIYTGIYSQLQGGVHNSEFSPTRIVISHCCGVH